MIVLEMEFNSEIFTFILTKSIFINNKLISLLTNKHFFALRMIFFVERSVLFYPNVKVFNNYLKVGK